MLKLLLAVVLLLTCGAKNDTTLHETPPHEDVQTPELSIEEANLELVTAFGADNLPEDYLIVSPNPNIVVNDNGDIIIGDENKLKIYNSNGSPKMILGHPGQGPNEYTYAWPLKINNKYITGIDRRSMTNRYSLYTTDYTFIKTEDPIFSDFNDKMLDEHEDWSYIQYNNIYHYEPDERLILTFIAGKIKDRTRISDPNPNSDSGIIQIVREGYHAAIYQKGNISEVLVVESKGNKKYRESGRIFFRPLPHHNFVYINAALDKKTENDLSYYFLSIYDIATHTITKIEKTYMPVAFPDSVIYPKKEYSNEYNLPDYIIDQLKKRAEAKSEYLKDLGFFPPVKNIVTDRDYIFVYTNQYTGEKGYVVDLFDAQQFEFLGSVYFLYEFSTISNGFGYRVHRRKDGFREIQKYLININFLKR